MPTMLYYAYTMPYYAYSSILCHSNAYYAYYAYCTYYAYLEQSHVWEVENSNSKGRPNLYSFANGSPPLQRQRSWLCCLGEYNEKFDFGLVFYHSNFYLSKLRKSTCAFANKKEK